MANRVNAIKVGVSLLDRLVDFDPTAIQEAIPYRVQSLMSMKQSVLQDLSWLLSTRCPLKKKDIDWEFRTTIDFGIPDFSDYYTANPEDWRRVAQILEKTIRIYEPRLADVRIKIPANQTGKILSLSLEAKLKVEGHEISVAFPIVITGKGENVVIKIMDDNASENRN